MGKVTVVGGKVGMTAPTLGSPSGYTELTYIESTGTQYIDTGFKPGAATRVVLDFENKGDYSSMSASVAPLFGARNGSSSAAFCLWIGSKSYAQYGDVAYNAFTAFTTNINSRLTYDMNTNNVIVGDGQVVCRTASFSTNYPLFLFGANNGGSSVGRYSSGKLYSCKIYDTGKLVRDYVPCVTNNGNIGLYDKVNQQFYGNSGTGTFIGSEV